MKVVSVSTDKSRDTVISTLRDYHYVNDGIRFNEKEGIPASTLTELKANFVFFSCNMLGLDDKDGGASIFGTFFFGKIKEREGVTSMNGIIITSPIFHLALIAFCIYFLIKSFIIGGITLVPLIMVIATYIMFRAEYKKQKIIKRFITRAFAKMNK